MDDERFDGLYLNVAQTTRGIEPLLDTVFSFLRRKTDFFSGPPGAEDGSAAAIAKVNEVLRKHADRYKADQLAAETKMKAKKKTKAKAKAKAKPPSTTTATTTQSTAKPQATPNEEEEIIEMSNDGGFDASTMVETKKPVIAPLGTSPTKESPTATATAMATTTNDTSPSSDTTTTATTTTTTTTATATTTTAPNKHEHEHENENDNGEAGEADEGAEGPPPEGNGGSVPGKYAWTQTLAEVTLVVPVPHHTRGRDVQVVIAPTHLKISLKSSNNASLSSNNTNTNTNTNKKEPIVDADLTKRIICDDSFWTIEDGNKLVINLQKKNQMEWWDSVCVGDPGINVQHIRPENSNLSDLDGETRKTVEKMMFDQRQKALGKPTSDEQSKLDALEMFKKQHPEMDFSNAKIS